MKKLTLALVVTFVSLFALRGSAQQEILSDGSENANREACKATHGKYLYPHAAPRCKCPIEEGLINNWSRGNLTQAADVCVADPKAKKPAAPKAEKVAKPAPKAEKVVVDYTMSLDPADSKTELGKSVTKTLEISGLPGSKAKTLRVECSNCVNEKGENTATMKMAATRSGAIKKTLTFVAPTGAKTGLTATVTVYVAKPDGTEQSVSSNIEWTAVEQPKSACVLSDVNATDLPDGKCDCSKAVGKDLASDGKTCVPHVLTACERSGGVNGKDGHCEKCSDNPLMMEGMENNVYKCVARPPLPPIVVKGPKGDRGDNARAGLYVHLYTELKLDYLHSESFHTSNLLFSAGVDLEVVPDTFNIYVLVGVGFPGARVTDDQGQPYVNANGNYEEKHLSGVVEGGVKYWFSKYVGLRGGVIFLPVGIDENLRFLHAGLGGTLGVEARFHLNDYVMLNVGPSLFVGTHLSQGDTAVGGLLNFGASFFNHAKTATGTETPPPAAPAPSAGQEDDTRGTF